MSRRIGSAIPEMIRSMIEKPSTEAYPFKKIELPERFRGKLEIDPMKCTGCSICAYVCPASVITMVDLGKRKVGEKEMPVKRPKFDLYTCIFCGECVDNCPFGALFFTKNFELATDHKETLVMTKALEQR
jgi:formate hydrogenlyase subunit 6/NADH:ubiquinone oxidoreductase subunit I